MGDKAAPPTGPLVTGSEIARLAGVTRAAVSNWRRRYDDFPPPAGGGAGSPLFSLADVQAWLDRQRKGQELSAEVRLWQVLRGAYGDGMVGGLADVFGLLAGGEPPAGLPEEAVRLARELAAAAPVAEVVGALGERFADSVRRAGSDQVTSARVVRAVCHFAGEVAVGATVFDPACGVGTLLLGVAPGQGAERYGQEVDERSARCAQLRADLTGLAGRNGTTGRGDLAGRNGTTGQADRADLPDLAGRNGRNGTTVATGDSLRADHWPDLRADLVVCDPPVGATDWGREDLLLDSRWEFGTPSRAEGELAWLQHAYAHTAPGGRVLMVMPASVAYRKAGRRIRAELVRRGVLTQIVALPPGTAASHALPVHLWELRRPESAGAAAASVRMVDLTANDPDGSLEPGPGQVAEVPLIDLLDDAVDLTPGRRIEVPHRDYAAEYRCLQRELADQMRGMAELLPALAAGAAPGVPDGPSVSVAELARAGLVAYDGAEPVSASDQLDTDYLQGFVGSAANIRRATSASGTLRLDGRGARVPQMDIADQRRYGAAFRAIREFEQRMRKVAELSREAAELARDGLGSGALVPEEPAG